MKIAIKDIKIESRFREKEGNIKELAENIKENGLIVPIVIDKNNKLVDGERRIKAFKLLDEKEISFARYPEHTIEAEASANLSLHFDIVEAVAIWDAMESYELLGKEAPLSESDRGLYRMKRASKLTGYSTDTLSKAKYVVSVATPEEIEQMRGKERFNSVDTYYRKYKLKEQKEEIKKMKLPKGEYDVIVIDPPWQYGDEPNKEKRRGATQYYTMTIEELEELELPTAENCVLWLWTTNAFLPDAIGLLDKWGFEYKTILTWNKQIMGTGRLLRNITEHCILCFKGKPYFNNTKWTTLISEKKTTHSTKPEIFYKMVEEICAGRKLDYFGRKERKGWDVYGDEVK